MRYKIITISINYLNITFYITIMTSSHNFGFVNSNGLVNVIICILSYNYYFLYHIYHLPNHDFFLTWQKWASICKLRLGDQIC